MRLQKGTGTTLSELPVVPERLIPTLLKQRRKDFGSHELIEHLDVNKPLAPSFSVGL